VYEYRHARIYAVSPLQERYNISSWCPTLHSSQFFEYLTINCCETVSEKILHLHGSSVISQLQQCQPANKEETACLQTAYKCHL